MQSGSISMTSTTLRRSVSVTAAAIFASSAVTGEPQLISSINDDAATLLAVARSYEMTLPHQGGC